MTEVEERLAVLLGVPVPTAGERVLEGRRLSMIGQVGKYDGHCASTVISDDSASTEQHVVHHQRNRPCINGIIMYFDVCRTKQGQKDSLRGASSENGRVHKRTAKHSFHHLERRWTG